MRYDKLTLMTIDKVQKCLINNFWNNNRHEVRQDILYLPVKFGGLGFPHMRSKFAAAKLKDLVRVLSDSQNADINEDLLKELKKNQYDDQKFLKKLGITINIENESDPIVLEIKYDNRTLQLGRETKFKTLYKFLVISTEHLRAFADMNYR